MNCISYYIKDARVDQKGKTTEKNKSENTNLGDHMNGLMGYSVGRCDGERINERYGGRDMNNVVLWGGDFGLRRNSPDATL
jgi:hypothetical protein